MSDQTFLKLINASALAIMATLGGNKMKPANDNINTGNTLRDIRLALAAIFGALCFVISFLIVSVLIIL